MHVSSTTSHISTQNVLYVCVCVTVTPFTMHITALIKLPDSKVPVCTTKKWIALIQLLFYKSFLYVREGGFKPFKY